MSNDMVDNIIPKVSGWYTPFQLIRTRIDFGVKFLDETASKRFTLQFWKFWKNE